MRPSFFGIMLCVIPILSAVGFVAVGHYVDRNDVHGFDWELASIFGTAIGTLLLALATGALARTTASDVSATREIAELTRQDRVDRFTPVVIGHVKLVGTSDLAIDLVNIGLGHAVKVSVSCRSDYATVATTTIAALGAGQKMQVNLGIAPTELGTPPPSIYANPDVPYRLTGNYEVTGHFLDWRGVRAGEILDWVQADPTTS